MPLSKKILFFIQNSTHMENLRPLIESASKFGYQADVIALSSDFSDPIGDIDQVKIISDVINFNVYHIFNNSGFFQKILIVKRFANRIKSLSNDYDFIISGNDSSFSRALYQQYPFSKTVVAFDSVLNYTDESTLMSSSDFRLIGRSLVRRLQRFMIGSIQKMLPRGLKAYFPSLIGRYPVDLIFCASERDIKWLIDGKSKAKKFLAIGVPRYRALHDYGESSMGSKRFNDGNGKLKLLYITQAFLYHSDPVGHAIQKAEMNTLKTLISGEHISLTLKLHPRDVIGDYVGFKFTEAKNDNPYFTLSDYDIILGLTSTLLLEASYLGFDTKVMRLTRGSSLLDNTVFSLPYFDAVYSLESLRSKTHVSQVTSSYIFRPYSDNVIASYFGELEKLE